MPYAYGATITHEFVVNLLKVWVTFKHPMRRSSFPLNIPVIYDIMPPLALWILKADTVPVNVISSAWQDEHTLLLTSAAVASKPVTVTLEYAGPNSDLETTWLKDWEPWGAINSEDVSAWVEVDPVAMAYINQSVKTSASPSFVSLTLTGKLKIPTTSATVGIIEQNSIRVFHTYGTRNIFIGEYSGNLTTSGDGENVGLGKDTLRVVTTGDNNMAIGAYALSNITTGHSNTAIGRAAGRNLVTGYNNMLFGRNAGYTTTGGANIFIGYYAGYLHTGSNHIIFDSRERASEAVEKSNAIIWGLMAAAPADQQLQLNAAVLIPITLAITGNTAANGGVTLGAGTTTVWPLKFQDGDLLTTPAAGVMEFDDGRFYITGTAKRQAIDRTTVPITATTTVANTTTETTIYTESLSANAAKAGRIYKLHADGILQNTAGADITFNVYFGDDLVATIKPSAKNYAAGTNWDLNFNATIRTVGDPGTGAIHGHILISDLDTAFNILFSPHTTGINAITVKVQWDTAHASNTLSIYQGYLELKN